MTAARGENRHLRSLRTARDSAGDVDALPPCDDFVHPLPQKNRMSMNEIYVSACALAIFGFFAMRMHFGKLVRDVTPLALIVAYLFLVWQVVGVAIRH